MAIEYVATGLGGGDALVANPLSQFAATTSAQFAGVISDETGTGDLVFATSPTLVTPALGTPASGVMTNVTGLPTAGMVDDAVTLAKMAAGTAGNLLTYDASGNPAAVATGTATHVLTSNGAGLAPTFQAATGGGLNNWGETTTTLRPNVSGYDLGTPALRIGGFYAQSLQLGPDSSNYWSHTVSASGALTMQGVGAGGSMTITPTAGQNIVLSTSGAGITQITGRVSQTGLGFSTFFGQDAGRVDDLSNNNNVGVGYQALYSNTAGANNAALGYDALRANNTGALNTAIGSNALRFNTNGDWNTANGANALFTSTTGDNNTANGVSALYLSTTGANNTAIGRSALYSNTTGANNAALGYEAGRYIADGATASQTTGTSVFLGADTKASANGVANETVIGFNAIGAGSNTMAFGNTSVVNNYFRTAITTRYDDSNHWTSTVNAAGGLTMQGVGAGGSMTITPTAGQNIVLSTSGAGITQITGRVSQTGLGRSTFFGEDAGRVDDLTNNDNVGVGYRALYSNTGGHNNAANGTYALYFSTTGHNNTANGTYALYSNTTGGSNTANGATTLYSNTTGANNTANGSSALYSNTTGASNTANGYQAIYSNTTGANNTASGYRAGRYIADGTTANQTTGTSVFLGASTKASANGVANETVIGFNAIGIGSNTVVLGNDSVVTTALKGNVGVGTTTPNANAILDVTSTTKAFMPPRMTTTQKNAIASPTAGMVIYDSDLAKLCVYTTAWETVTSV